MVAAGRRAGVGGGGRRRVGCGGQQHRMLVAAVAAAGTEEDAAGAAGCCVEFLECLLGALGVTAAPAPAQYRWATRSISRRRRGGASADAQGRIAGNGASASDAASLYTMQGKKGVNQDAMVLWEVTITRSNPVK
jgi:hypothetical protein